MGKLLEIFKQVVVNREPYGGEVVCEEEEGLAESNL